MSSHPDEGHDDPAMTHTSSAQANGSQVTQNNRSFLGSLLLGLLGMRFPPAPMRTVFGFVSQKCAAGFRWMLAHTLQGAERLFFRSHVVRASTRTNLGLSARGAASTHIDGSKTSAGASTNIAEVVDIIDQALRGGMREGLCQRYGVKQLHNRKTLINQMNYGQTHGQTSLRASRQSRKHVQIAGSPLVHQNMYCKLPFIHHARPCLSCCSNH